MDWSVVVVGRGMQETTLKFIESLLATTANQLEIIYIDNGSPDYSAWNAISDLRLRVPLKMHRFEEGVCLSKAWNTGVKLSSGRKILICNNDLTFQKSSWLEQFDTQLANPEVGVTGMTGMSWMNTPFIQGSLFAFRSENAKANYWGPELCCYDPKYLFDGSNPEYVIGFDERFLFTCEDVDFCKRLQLEGKTIAPLDYLLKDGWVKHEEGATRNFYKQDTIKYQRLAHISRIEFCYKWTFPDIRITD